MNGVYQFVFVFNLKPSLQHGLRVLRPNRLERRYGGVALIELAFIQKTYQRLLERRVRAICGNL